MLFSHIIYSFEDDEIEVLSKIFGKNFDIDLIKCVREKLLLAKLKTYGESIRHSNGNLYAACRSLFEKIIIFFDIKDAEIIDKPVNYCNFHSQKLNIGLEKLEEKTYDSFDWRI